MVHNIFVCTLPVKKICDCGIFWGEYVLILAILYIYITKESCQ